VTTPLSETVVFRRLGLAMINPHTKFEVTHYENMKGNTNCRNWGGLRGYTRRSPKVISNVCIR